MKVSKSLLKTISIFLLLSFILTTLAACGSNSGDKSKADSEKAMENFVSKLDSGNYVLRSGEYITVTVSSPEQVVFDYTDASYTDFAYMSLNGETFRTDLPADAVGEVSYISQKSALKVATKRLPNSWIDASDGNMFNLFYNDPENPLTFSSHDENVKYLLLSLAGLGEMAYSKMQDVYVEMDKEDPSTVHITAVVDDDPVARIYYDDVDITITFGNAAGDARIEKWLSDPVYPETRTAWEDGDLFYLNSIFLPGYGEEAVPFPSFASYAMAFDEDVFAEKTEIYLIDGQATEADVENYKATLLANGFHEETETLADGSSATVYRKLLREDYRSYASLNPYYDNGFVLEAKRYYDNPTYSNLADINDLIQKFGFLPLENSENLSGWTAIDSAAERTESWLFFFDYVLSLLVTVQYEDVDALNQYLEAYGNSLMAAGYHPEYIAAGEEGDVLDYYASPNGASTFRYADNQDGTITLQFRNEKDPSTAEVNQKIVDAGFPAITLFGNMFCRDISRYHMYTRGFKGLYLAISQPFDSPEAAEAFLDQYTAVLEDSGFFYENPTVIGSLKQIAYYDEERDMFVAFDYFPDGENTLVTFDFVVN